MRRLFIIIALCLFMLGISAASADTVDLSVTTVSAVNSQGATTFVLNSSDTVTVGVTNFGIAATTDLPITLQITIPAAFTVGSATSSGSFACATAANVVTCTIASGSIAAGDTEQIIVPITATTVAAGVSVTAALTGVDRSEQR